MSATTFFPTESRRRKPQASLALIAFQAAAVIGTFAIPSVAALLVDPRQLNDVSVWDKPLKFEIALGVHLVTLALLAPLFTAAAAQTRLVRGAYLTTAFATLGELSYLVLQAARGRQSHFNFTTPLETAMYSLMGVGAVALVVCAFIIGWRIRAQTRPEIGTGLRLGAAWGLMLGAGATLVVAGIMSSGQVGGYGHWVGGVRSDAHGLPLTGWSTTGGDLRVAHFFATHLMQALPLLGLAADRWAPRLAGRIVGGGAAFGLLVVSITFGQALLGRPLI
jgi:hypothetical protein